MSLLEKHKDLKIEHRVQAEKQQEFKLVGRQKKRPGQHIFGYDPETKTVYKLEIVKEEVVDITKKMGSASKAIVNTKHSMLWSFDMKNAIRKFRNGGLEVLNK